jgi:hypothetical protein
MGNWCLNVSRSPDKLQTQNLFTVGTIKKKQYILKIFLKSLGVKMSDKLILKMQQNINRLRWALHIKLKHKNNDEKIQPSKRKNQRGKCVSGPSSMERKTK